METNKLARLQQHIKDARQHARDVLLMQNWHLTTLDYKGDDVYAIYIDKNYYNTVNLSDNYVYKPRRCYE